MAYPFCYLENCLHSLLLYPAWLPGDTRKMPVQVFAGFFPRIKFAGICLKI